MNGDIFSTILLVLSTIVVIILAYYATIIVGKNAKTFLRRRYVKVLDKSNIGLNTSLVILKINKKIYIIAQQTKAIELLDIIDEEDWDFHNNEADDSIANKDKYPDSYIGNITRRIKKNKNKRYDENGSEKNE